MHTKSRKMITFSRNATTHTDRQTDTIHTSFSLPQPISREHNSPSGKNLSCETQSGLETEIYGGKCTLLGQTTWTFAVSEAYPPSPDGIRAPPCSYVRQKSYTSLRSCHRYVRRCLESYRTFGGRVFMRAAPNHSWIAQIWTKIELKLPFRLLSCVRRLPPTLYELPRAHTCAKKVTPLWEVVMDVLKDA